MLEYFIKNINNQEFQIADLYNGESDQILSINELKTLPDDIKVYGLDKTNPLKSRDINSLALDAFKLIGINDEDILLHDNKIYFRTKFINLIKRKKLNVLYDKETDLYYIELYNTTNAVNIIKLVA